jgi:polysaccharide pyruvyl transferase WcaK-like protein
VLRGSAVRLVLLTSPAAALHRLVPWLRGTVERAVPEVRVLATADVLLDQGGITFADGRNWFLVYNVASVLPALLLGTPVVKCAQAMGPFTDPVNRRVARAVLPRMAAIVSRGAVTHGHLQALGLGNVTAGADLAFTLDVTDDGARAAREAVDESFFDSGDVVGVSPSAVLRKGGGAAAERYVSEVVRMVDHLTCDLDRKVLLVAHSARAHSQWSHNNDLPLCREVHARVAAPDMVLFPDQELTSQALRYLIGRCDLFVASRFHAMVSSLAMGVPTLVIGWSHKYGEVLDSFGLAQWAVGHEAYTDEVFVARFAALVRRRAEVRAQLAAGLPAVRALAAEQVDAIERAVR